MNQDFISLVSNRYIELFEKITEQNFNRVDTSNLLERVKENIEKSTLSKYISTYSNHI